MLGLARLPAAPLRETVADDFDLGEEGHGFAPLRLVDPGAVAQLPEDIGATTFDAPLLAPQVEMPRQAVAPYSDVARCRS